MVSLKLSLHTSIYDVILLLVGANKQ